MIEINDVLLYKLLRRARERWSDARIDRIVVKRSKYVLYMYAGGFPVKIVIYRDGRVRAFSRAIGLSISMRKLVERVLGVEPQRESRENP